MPNAVSFSIVTKNTGILTKEFSLTEENKLEKDSSKCKLTTGSVKRIDVDFKNVGTILDGLELNQAITLGVPSVREGDLVASGMEGKNPEAVTRTKKEFKFTKKGFMIYFDYDPAPGQTPLTKEELIKSIRDLHPDLATAAMLWRPSSSSFIYNSEEQLSGLTGQHIYVPCKNPDNLDAFISTLKCECWFKDLGWIMVSAAGTALERVLFDTAVFSPERLVFEAGACVQEPLTQELPATEYYPGKIIDLKKVELLNPSFLAPVKDLIAQKKLELSEEITKVRKKYVEAQAKKLAESTDIKVAKAKKIIAGRYEGVLLSNDCLQNDDDELISVKEILGAPEDYIGMAFRDPLEPDYGKSKAKIFVNEDGSVICNSFAHGGRTFRLKHDDETFENWLKSADMEEIEENWMSMVLSASNSAVAEERLLSRLKDVFNVGVVALRRDLKVYKKEDMKEVEKKNKAGEFGYLAGLVPPDEEVELTQDQIAELYIKRLPNEVVGAEGLVYQYNGKSIWEGLDLNTVQQNMIPEFDGLVRCSRKTDYTAITKHIYDKLKDEKFFTTHQPCFATPSSCYVVNGRNINEVDHHSKYRIRHMFEYDADPDWPIPMFKDFLAWVFHSDETQITLLQEIFGAVLFGILNYQFHKAVLFKGPGANGKGVMFNIIRNIVPEAYTCVVSPFAMKQGKYRALLAGKLLNLVPELPSNRQIPGEIFKQIVDSSIVSARRMYMEPFDFVPVCSQIFSSNYFIDSDDASEGMLRRWLLLGFDSVVGEKDRINDFGKVITDAEAPGILYWALEGAVRLLEQNHFSHTVTHDKMMEQWTMRIDPVVGFVFDEDWVMHTSGTLLSREVAFAAYLDWCEKTQHKQITKAEFTEGMEKRYSVTRHKGDWCYQGLQLLKGGSI